MTDDKYKLIFLHFVKTGGSSIENYFGKGDGYAETMLTLTSGQKKLVREQHHFSSKQYIQTNGKDVWDDCYKFSFVRNPWDWFVSHFFHDIKQYKVNERLGRPQKYRRSFIVDECNSDFKTYVKKGMQRPDWFKFPSMKEYSKGVDFIGRFESLQSDFDHVCRQIGAPVKQLAHLKKPDPRGHYSSFYDKESKEHVYNLMKNDIEYFEYEF